MNSQYCVLTNQYTVLGGTGDEALLSSILCIAYAVILFYGNNKCICYWAVVQLHHGSVTVSKTTENMLEVKHHSIFFLNNHKQMLLLFQNSLFCLMLRL